MLISLLIPTLKLWLWLCSKMDFNGAFQINYLSGLIHTINNGSQRSVSIINVYQTVIVNCNAGLPYIYYHPCTCTTPVVNSMANPNTAQKKWRWFSSENTVQWNLLIGSPFSTTCSASQQHPLLTIKSIHSFIQLTIAQPLLRLLFYTIYQFVFALELIN